MSPVLCNECGALIFPQAKKTSKPESLNEVSDWYKLFWLGGGRHLVANYKIGLEDTLDKLHIAKNVD